MAGHLLLPATCHLTHLFTPHTPSSPWAVPAANPAVACCHPLNDPAMTWHSAHTHLPGTHHRPNLLPPAHQPRHLPISYTPIISAGPSTYTSFLPVIQSAPNLPTHPCSGSSARPPNSPLPGPLTCHRHLPTCTCPTSAPAPHLHQLHVYTCPHAPALTHLPTCVPAPACSFPQAHHPIADYPPTPATHPLPSAVPFTSVLLST
jgi:hypothetical protein